MNDPAHDLARKLFRKEHPQFDLEKKYYLAGPMSGYPEYNYPLFQQSALELRLMGLELECPNENPWPDESAGKLTEEELWKHMMALTGLQLSTCQGIILLKGWPQSRGARSELGYALDHQFLVYYYQSPILTDMNRRFD